LPDKRLAQNGQDDLALCLALLVGKYDDLAVVVKHWPNLPEATKRAIVGLLDE
jgi:hypothetical protein